MMKKLFLLLFLQIAIGIPATICVAQVITPDALRRSYVEVSKDSASCARLYQKVIKSQNADNITTAYRGAVTAAMSNHSKSKKEKLALFNSGKKLLEQSITSDSSSIETRFLRLSIQTACPKALNYYKQINPDKAFILKNYPTETNLAIKRMISSFALQSASFSEAEKQKLK